jgi:23S rRNA pseudouridine1911/1915/1917 synthase
MLTVPLPGRDAASAKEVVEAHLRSSQERLFVVHRIDEFTSGLVMFARTLQAQAALKAQFLRREPERVYWAVVYGHPEPSEGVWRDMVAWDDTAMIQKQTHPNDPRAKEAVSRYRVLERFAATSLVEVRLETGKRNQIRLQARLRGHTLVGERRYVFGPDQLRPIAFPRQALHARRIAFRHPRDDRPLAFEAPLPADMRELIDRLRKSR